MFAVGGFMVGLVVGSLAALSLLYGTLPIETMSSLTNHSLPVVAATSTIAPLPPATGTTLLLQ